MSLIATLESRRAPARHGLVAILLAGLTLAIAAVTSYVRWPMPTWHDEFSYLLASDTFCHGRLANPVPPHWEHFESFHIILHPTYASKYPPGQGIVLAVGQWLTGWPIAGVWLLSAAAAAAYYWMALGWTSPRWAAVAGLLFVFHPGFQFNWGQTYWGGTLAFLGGALVWGAAGRIVRGPRASHGAMMALGAVTLAVSRPFEGLVFCLVTGGWLIIHWLRSGWPTRGELLRLAIPFTAVIALSGVGLADYNRAVTGSSLTLPYTVHEAQYARCPMFLWQAPLANEAYRHPVMANFHNDWAMNWYRDQQSVAGVIQGKWELSKLIAGIFLPPILMLPLLFVRPWRLGRLEPVVAVLALTYFVTMASIWNFPHYVAMLAPLVLLTITWGLRRADAIGRRTLGWGYVAHALIAVQIGAFVWMGVVRATAPRDGWQWQRARLADQLAHEAGRHLVFVHYDLDHDPLKEWVYNAADIPGAKTVWAREMSMAQDEELIHDFNDRRVWRVAADQASPQLVELPRQKSASHDERPAPSNAEANDHAGRR